MPWETRARGDRYYTRSRRVNGRVVREYFGCGKDAIRAAAEDAARRQAEAAVRAAEVADRATLAEVDAAMAELDALAGRCFRAAMEAAGYHQHDRGPWRKRRVPKLAPDPSPAPAATSPLTHLPPGGDRPDGLDAVAAHGVEAVVEVDRRVAVRHDELQPVAEPRQLRARRRRSRCRTRRRPGCRRGPASPGPRA